MSSILTKIFQAIYDKEKYGHYIKRISIKENKEKNGENKNE